MIMIKDDHLEKVERTLKAVTQASAIHGWIHEDAVNCLALINLAKKGYPAMVMGMGMNVEAKKL